MDTYYVVGIDCVDDSEISLKAWEKDRAHDWLIKNQHEGMGGVMLEIHRVKNDYGHEIPISIHYYYNEDAYKELE